SYIEMLKKTGLQDYVFNELDTMMRLDYAFQEQDVELSSVSGLADMLFIYPNIDVDKMYSLIYEKSPKDFLFFLNQLKSENLTVYIQQPSAKTTQTEKFYQVEYSVNTVK